MFCAQRENKTILGNVLSPIENYNFTQWNDSGFMSASLKTSNRKSTPIIWFFFPNSSKQSYWELFWQIWNSWHYCERCYKFHIKCQAWKQHFLVYVLVRQIQVLLKHEIMKKRKGCSYWIMKPMAQTYIWSQLWRTQFRITSKWVMMVFPSK